ncbi:MAG: DNA (cytosine-5-)-methyltransferase [Phycisphaerales bacterium]|nr:DNA (cytosine-5-)-methyltransferase [Phycisphaerales bacterium]
MKMIDIQSDNRQTEIQSTGIRAVELFCGIGGFRLACDSLGFETVWANDMNPLSCEVYREAFGTNEIVSGDIRTLHSEIPQHELLTAGFPCQPFSSAGKKQGVRDSRGTLFEEIVTVIKNRCPKWFVLENVKRLLSMEKGDHFATILQALSELDYFVEWRLLNATAFGLPQNRQRVVIAGTRVSSVQDARISLASESDLRRVFQSDIDRLKDCQTWQPLDKHKKSFNTWGVCYKGRFFAEDLNEFSDSVEFKYLDSILEKKPDEKFYMDESTVERIKESIHVDKLVNGVHVLYNQKGGARMGYSIFGTRGVAPTLTASHSRHYERYQITDRYRRLTNVEYARLQGFPDSHCSIATPFNQYGLFGNAVPPPLAKWAIQKTVMSEGIEIAAVSPRINTQMSLYI